MAKTRRKSLVTSELVALLIMFAIFTCGFVALYLLAAYFKYISPIAHLQRVVDVVVGISNPENLKPGIFLVAWAVVLFVLVLVGMILSIKHKRGNAILPIFSLIIGFAIVGELIACMTRDNAVFGGYVYLIAGELGAENAAIDVKRLLIGVGILACGFIACFISLILYGTALRDQHVEVKTNKERKIRNQRLEDIFRTIVREELENYFKNNQVVTEAPAVEEPAQEVVPAIAPVVEAAPEVTEETNKIERIPFANRLTDASDELKYNYNVLKSEFLSYGLKSRLSNAGDTFRLHRKTFARIIVAGKGLKVYFALDPKDYADSTIPVQDVSNKNLYAEIPLAFKVKSDLSVKRCKQLIADMMAKEGYEQGEVEVLDWASNIQEVSEDDED